MNNKKLISIIVVVLVLAALGAGVWYWSQRKIQGPGEPAAFSLGAQIFEKTQNQLEGQVPDTNPFKDQKNPFDTIYKNPFK